MQGDRGPSGTRGLKGDIGDKGPVGSRGPAGKHGIEGGKGPPGKIGKMGPVGSKGEIGARGEKVTRGSGIVGIQGTLGMQGPVGTTGGQGDRGPKGDKGDRSAPAGEIDIVSDLPIAIVEQYHRSAYARYAINSMKDIELHGAAHVKTIIAKVVVAMRFKVMLRGRLLFQILKSIVITYLISIMMHTTWKRIYATFTIFVCFWFTKFRLWQKLSIGNTII